jgi:hypothetical protein
MARRTVTLNLDCDVVAILERRSDSVSEQINVLVREHLAIAEHRAAVINSLVDAHAASQTEDTRDAS